MSPRDRRIAFWTLAFAVVAALVYLMATGDTGPTDPTEVRGEQSHATVVFNSAIIVFREGLEAVLIFAAVTASFLGANRRRRRPVVAGAAVAFAAAVLTWFVVQAVMDAASPLGPRLEAITGSTSPPRTISQPALPGSCRMPPPGARRSTLTPPDAAR